MSNFYRNLFLREFCFLLFFGLTLSCNQKANKVISIEPGISEELAIHRKETLANVNYEISLAISADKASTISASETINFTLKEKDQTLQIDFKEEATKLKTISVNGKEIPILHQNEHILIDKKFLREGANKVLIVFTAGNLSLNRNEDFLYTLLVPDRARTVFPCFDQPDIKATYDLTLTVPLDWQAVSNAPMKDSAVTAANKTYNFQTSDLVSTYLFSFVAGKFEKVKSSLDREMYFFHRETDTSKINHSLEPVFKLHSDALKFLGDYTGIKYPFKKFDFAAIPDFQYGGMEHPGAIQYRAASVFLDRGSTKDEELNRANLIAHETSHMWFGDLVTMRWFNDVWMKEVFANFMADKITNASMPSTNYDLQFLLDHSPAAYSVDRTKGANPIRQNLENLAQAGSLYGNIIYHKAPIVMRQLERLMGKDPFRKGLQEYLKKYANGNATWSDLIDILDKNTELDLKAWNKVWVDEPGRPQLAYSLTTNGNKIAKLVMTQQGEDGSHRVWPQVFELALVYADRTEQLIVAMNEKEVNIKGAEGKEKPSYILFNSSGGGYGLFPLDSAMLTEPTLSGNAVMRASAYINLYENMLSGRYIKPEELLKKYTSSIVSEAEELNLRLITGQLSDVYWRLILPGKRTELSTVLEQAVWSALEKEPQPNKKKILFRTYQSISLSKVAQDRLYTIWKENKPPAGVILTEDDYTSLAFALALRNYPDQNLLSGQLSRIKNIDRKKRFEFLTSALSSDQSVRDAFFTSLKKEENREKESWVLSALQLLHHPLRANTSQKYLATSLDLLEEIQKTGDIFFPQSWLSATFGSYQTAEAAKVVQRFLDEHPAYNPKLRAKILQSTDALFRAVRLVESN